MRCDPDRGFAGKSIQDYATLDDTRRAWGTMSNREDGLISK